MHRQTLPEDTKALQINGFSNNSPRKESMNNIMPIMLKSMPSIVLDIFTSIPRHLTTLVFQYIYLHISNYSQELSLSL